MIYHALIFLKAQTNFNNISIFSEGALSASGATVGGIGHIYYNTRDIKSVNTINSKINTITIHASGESSYIGACVGLAHNTANIINLTVNDVHLVTLNEHTYSALAIGWSIQSSNTIYAKAHTFTSHNTGDHTYVGGIVGYIIGKFPMSLQSPLAQFQDPSHTIAANVGKALIRNTGKHSVTGMMVGYAVLKGEPLNLWLQGGQINILTNATPSALVIGYLDDIAQSNSCAVVGNVIATVNGQPSAIGVGKINPLSSSQNISVLFIAGQAELSDPAFILQPGTCPDSLVDQSGINVNIDTLGCKNAHVVQSIEPQGWRNAMERLQPILCSSKHLSCHYLNEQPVALATIPSSSGRFYLVSQQRYPYNRTAERDALVRVTGLKLLSHQFNPSVDPLFGSDGTALYRPNNNTLLSHPPHSVNIDGDNLYHLYKESDQPVLARFKLNNANDIYHRNPLITEGDVIQLDQGGVWLQRNHSLEHYIIDPTTLSLKNKDKVIQLTTNSTNVSAPVIGAQFFGQGIYVARLIDNNSTHSEAQTSILYEQYPVNSNHTPEMWSDSICGNFFNVNQYTMQVVMKNNDHAFIALLPSTELLINNNGSEVVAYTAHLLPQGGPAKWSYRKPLIFAVHSLQSESDSKNLTTVITVSISAVLTFAGLITLSTCIFCRQKYYSCLHKSKYFHINKEKNNNIDFSVAELSPSFLWNERSPLFSNQQCESAKIIPFWP